VPTKYIQAGYEVFDRAIPQRPMPKSLPLIKGGIVGGCGHGGDGGYRYPDGLAFAGSINIRLRRKAAVDAATSWRAPPVPLRCSTAMPG